MKKFLYLLAGAGGYVLAAVFFIADGSVHTVEQDQKHIASDTRRSPSTGNSVRSHAEVEKELAGFKEKLLTHMKNSSGGRVDIESVNLMHEILNARPGEIDGLIDQAISGTSDLATKILFLRELAAYPSSSTKILEFAQQEAASSSGAHRVAAVQVVSVLATDPRNAQAHNALTTFMKNEKDPLAFRAMLGTLGGTTFAPDDRKAFVDMLKGKSNDIGEPGVRAASIGILARFEPTPENLTNVVSELGSAKTDEARSVLLGSLRTDRSNSETPGMEQALLAIISANDASKDAKSHAAYILTKTTQSSSTFRAATEVLGGASATTTYQ